MNFEKVGIHIPTILFPSDGVNLTKWAVVACDQYTSQPDYWHSVEKVVGSDPSTLNLVFPEVYVENGDAKQRTANIHTAMAKFAGNGVLKELKPGFVLVKRTLSSGKKRNGLVVALDLEHYDYNAGALSLIRTTEGTIMNRLPTRIEVRKKSAMEIPHIMVLIDDPDRTVIEPLFEKKLEELYNFDLMEGAGHIQGHAITEPAVLEQIGQRLEHLLDAKVFNEKYGLSGQTPFLYAMGDGNHSFAAAKVIWEELKAAAPDKAAIMNHPARYGLVELVNIHDTSLDFEPIHRVLFKVTASDLLVKMGEFFNECIFSCTYFENKEQRKQFEKQNPKKGHRIPFVTGDGHGLISIEKPMHGVEAASFHAFIDEYIKAIPAASMDYLHGDAVVDKLGTQAGNIGFYLPPIAKDNFFKTLITDSAFPRKTFSMGEADDKRFYLECRRIM